MKSTAINLATGALVTLTCFAALEGLSRLAGGFEIEPPLMAASDTSWHARHVYDPLLFWSLRPHALVDAGERTNSLGMRGPEISPKADDEYRILSLGESSTFAVELPSEQSYSARLERELVEVDGRRVRVINAGVPAYTLFQGWVLLDRWGFDFDPDLVLVYFGYNDLLPVGVRDLRDAGLSRESRGLTDRELYELRSGTLARLSSFLVAHSNLYRMMASSLYRRPGRMRATRDTTKVRVPDGDRRWLLERIRAECAERGIDFVVLIPWYRTYEKHVPLLREFATQDGVAVVDLPALLRAVPRPRESYFLDTLHPNADGHRLIASTLARELARIVPGARARGAW
jgi:lysophospholipase L1-like esterase